VVGAWREVGGDCVQRGWVDGVQTLREGVVGDDVWGTGLKGCAFEQRGTGKTQTHTHIHTHTHTHMHARLHVHATSPGV
jgi:hypothetical protein